MFDSHCHLDAAEFDADRSAVLERACFAGVREIVVPAVDEASWSRIVALAKGAADGLRIHPALGIHPLAVPACDGADDDALMERLEAHVARSRPVAIGECGLDATIDLAKAPLERQERLLRAQLAIARRHALPVVFHVRGPTTYERLARLLDETGLPHGGVIHSYGGGAEVLKRFLDHPVMFGFAGPVTYPNARKVRASMVAVPEGRLLAETDAPDQAPAPHRPARCEPAHLVRNLEAMAAARGVSLEHLAAVTTDNARRLFGLGCAP